MPSSDKSEKTQGKKAEKESKSSSPVDPLKQAYFSVEDKYYELMDYLEDKVRVPVYEYFVEPIEKNGVPSFPIGVLLILLVGLGAFMVATGGGQTGEVSISLLSAAGKAVNGATVTLYLGDTNGDIIGEAVSSNGKATFSGVPMGKPLYVTVSAANFKAYEKALGEVTADTPTIKISLEDVETSPSVYRLTVVDEDGLPIAGAMVKAKSLANVQVGVYSTDAKGIAKIQLPSTDSLLVTITRTGYSNVTDFGIDPEVGLLQTVTLKKPGSECANGACDKKATVIVKVLNSQQQAVQAQVVLTSSLGSTLGSAATSGGQAALANIPVGTKAIISVTPFGADVGKYETYNYYDYLVASDENIVTVTMVASSSSGLAPIFISVADESGKPLSAEVSLYSERSDTPMGKTVARSGEANFSTDNVSSYATAYVAGYLPKAVSGLKPGSREKLVLRKILAGTAGSLEVQVIDADGTTPVAQASLTVRSSDGRNAGYPAVRTNADGKAVIGNVSLGIDYKVYADKSPKSGKSAIYRASEGDATKVTVKLDPTTATIVVSTRDAVNDTGLPATVVAYGSGMANTSCTTTYYNSYACPLTVRAESTVYVETTTSSYETTTSPGMVLTTGDSKAYTAYLLPSSFKDQFFVKFAGLFDEAGKNVTLVDKGRQYDAKFIVNIPSGSSTSKTGLMVRAGTSGKDSLAATDSKEKFAIIADGTTVTSTDPVFAASYLPSTSCSNDRKSNSELGYFKWVAFSFAGESGSREITVRILSKTDAASTDKLQLNYNGWYSAGGSAGDVYLRSPEDSDFGSALRSASRDYCYAKSDKAEFAVASGRSTCTSSACISLDFSDGTANYGPSYLGEVNLPLIAKVEVRLLKGVQSPKLFVSSDGGNMQITHYSIATDSETKALDSTAKAISNVTVQMMPFSDPAALTFDLLPVVPVTSGVFTMRFYDGQTELVSAKGYVDIEGTGKMKIVYVKPDHINTSEYADVAVKLADANSGVAITDATLSINETSGAPFDGNIPEPMTGSSVFSSGQGYNGIYTFEDLYPSANGVFEVIAEQPSYATVRQNVTVNSDDFLSVTPINLEVCGKSDERSIKVLNSLSVNLSIVATSSCAIMSSYVYSQTAYDENSVPTSYYNSTSEVAYDSFSQSYKLNLPENRLGIFTVRPAAFGKTCSIVFNAVGRDKSKAVQTVKYTTCSSDSADKFLSVTPSKVICTSDEGNCDTSSTITISNNLSSDVDGTVSVTVKGASLVLDPSTSSLAAARPGASLLGTGLATGRTASFDGTLTSLDSGYTFEMARGASVDLSIIPASINKTLQLVVTAIAGTRKATAAVEIKNCPGVVDTVGPSILSSFPASGTTIDYTPFNMMVTTDKAAVCKVANQYVFPADSSNQVHTMEMSLNAGTDTAPLASGQNSYSVTCCNLAENGGKCSTAAKTISFKFKLESEDLLENGEDCEANDECESGYCNSKGVCAEKISGTESCGPNGIVCSSSCTEILESGATCKTTENCCANGYDCDSTSLTCKNAVRCTASQYLEDSVCVACKTDQQPADSASQCCSKFISNGKCVGSSSNNLGFETGCNVFANDCSVTGQVCVEEDPTAKSKANNNNYRCVCNKEKLDAVYNGCPRPGAPYCIQVGTQMPVCSSFAAPMPSGCLSCKPPEMCISDGSGNGKCSTTLGTVTAIPTQSPTSTPAATPGVVPSSAVITLSLKNAKVYQNGAEMAKAASGSYAVPVAVSSIIPVTGFILQIDNTGGNAVTSSMVSYVQTNVVLKNLDGSSVTGISIPANGKISYIVKYLASNGELSNMYSLDKDTGAVSFTPQDAKICIGNPISGLTLGVCGNNAGVTLSLKFTAVDTSAYTFAFGTLACNKTHLRISSNVQLPTGYDSMMWFGTSSSNPTASEWKAIPKTLIADGAIVDAFALTVPVASYETSLFRVGPACKTTCSIAPLVSVSKLLTTGTIDTNKVRTDLNSALQSIKAMVTGGVPLETALKALDMSFSDAVYVTRVDSKGNLKVLRFNFDAQSVSYTGPDDVSNIIQPNIGKYFTVCSSGNIGCGNPFFRHNSEFCGCNGLVESSSACAELGSECDAAAGAKGCVLTNDCNLIYSSRPGWLGSSPIALAPDQPVQGCNLNTVSTFVESTPTPSPSPSPSATASASATPGLSCFSGSVKLTNSQGTIDSEVCASNSVTIGTACKKLQAPSECSCSSGNACVDQLCYVVTVCNANSWVEIPTVTPQPPLMPTGFP